MSKTPVRVPVIDLKAQYAEVGPALEEAAIRVLRSIKYIMGPDVAEFEADAARYFGVKHAVGVTSGTDAIVVALMALGVGPGDEVIVPAMTFIATAEAVRTAGGVPVFADVDPETITIDPKSVEKAITPRTKAVVAVHLYGNACDMEALGALCARRKILLVEDVAQGHGGTYRGKKLGAIGKAGCFSCFPAKNLGACGDAGFLTTDDDETARLARMIRIHGAPTKYKHEVRGLNARLDTLQAALLRVKLPHLDRWVQGRRRVAAAYRKAFAGLPIRLQKETEPGGHAYHLFTVQVENREALAAHLAERGIETAVHYPIALHQQPAFAHMKLGPGSFPAAERAAAQVLSIPVYPEMTDAQVEEVIAGIKSFR